MNKQEVPDAYTIDSVEALDSDDDYDIVVPKKEESKGVPVPNPNSSLGRNLGLEPLTRFEK